jgi:hypothetical protein
MVNTGPVFKTGSCHTSDETDETGINEADITKNDQTAAATGDTPGTSAVEIIPTNTGTPGIKESDMSKTTHGFCNHCKRDDVNLPSPGKCSRCYSRIRRGLDVITGEPLAIPSVPPPAIQAVDLGETGINEAQFLSTENIGHSIISLEALLDEVWQQKRTQLLGMLDQCNSNLERLQTDSFIMQELNDFEVE